MAFVQTGGCRCCSKEAKAIQEEIDLFKESMDDSPESKAKLEDMYSRFRAAAAPRWTNGRQNHADTCNDA